MGAHRLPPTSIFLEHQPRPALESETRHGVACAPPDVSSIGTRRRVPFYGKGDDGAKRVRRRKAT
jgi:hypothetical protein